MVFAIKQGDILHLRIYRQPCSRMNLTLVRNYLLGVSTKGFKSLSPLFVAKCFVKPVTIDREGY